MLIHFVVLAWSALILIWGTCALARHGRGAWRFFVIGLAHAAAMLGVIGTTWGINFFPAVTSDPGRAVLQALPPALALAVPSAFASIWMQRRTNPLGTINPFLPSAILALLLGGGTVAGVGWHHFGNGWLDTSEGRLREAVILRDGTIMPKTQETEEQSRPRDLDPILAVPGSRVTIRIKSGYYGVKWIAGIERTRTQ
ncbi:MAG: hypothetical protein EOL86_00950 [Deltaproteobacteria bacterium]|nr:hypothetical protein [Deltaproteobacteria bacterium]